jgi:hypothetical protein
MNKLSYDRNTKLINYQYKDKTIIFDSFENFYWIIDTIKKDDINWLIDDNNLLYCIDDNNKKIYLAEKILNINIENKQIEFIDNNIFNYSSSNLKLIGTSKSSKSSKSSTIINNKTTTDVIIDKIDNKLPDNFPDNYEVIQCYEGHKVLSGKKSGQVFNPYWLVYEKNDTDKKEFYIMSTNENDTYFKISNKSINYIRDKTWFLNQNGYIANVDKESRKQYYLHQLICKTEKGDESETKSVDHINRNKLDNRIENLRWATQSEQNSNTDKRARKHNAKPLPEGLNQKDLPKYVVYYHEWLDKDKKRSREFFKIEKHPKLNKIWFGSKSNKISIQDKLKEAKDKLNEIEAL